MSNYHALIKLIINNQLLYHNHNKLIIFNKNIKQLVIITL